LNESGLAVILPSAEHIPPAFAPSLFEGSLLAHALHGGEVAHVLDVQLGT
jgi:hypothetical protein